MILAISRHFSSLHPPLPRCGWSSPTHLTSLAAAVWVELCRLQDGFSSHWLLFAKGLGKIKGTSLSLWLGQGTNQHRGKGGPLGS